jgi:NAD(P)-dependent dehydrogenase (short-subunit alcohol dehydrogenase family)
MHRIAGILALELADRGIRAYNVQPGFISTERMAQDMGAFGFDSSAGAPPDVVGAVVTWLVTDPAAAELNGTNLEAQDRRLLPGWPA